MCDIGSGADFLATAISRSSWRETKRATTGRCGIISISILFRAGLVNALKGESILNYPWSSVAGGYALLPQHRTKWLAAEKGLSIMGYADTASRRREMVEHLDRRGAEEGKESGWVPLPEETDGRMSHLRRGWYWGRQEFAQRALELAAPVIRKGRSRAYGRNRERLAHGTEEAEKLLHEGLPLAGLKAEQSEAFPANERRKVGLARLVWRKTTVSQTWIAERLKMRNAANVSLALHRARPGHQGLPVELQKFLEQMKENAHCPLP